MSSHLISYISFEYPISTSDETDIKKKGGSCDITKLTGYVGRDIFRIKIHQCYKNITEPNVVSKLFTHILKVNSLFM